MTPSATTTLIVAATLPFAASATARTTPGAAPPPAFVVVAANRMAAALVDKAPTSAQYVLTRHKAAMYASSGGTGTTNQPVYLIVLTGHLETGQVGPAPGTIVAGRFASEVLDAKTGRDTDFSIGPKPIPIRSLGLVGNLLPYMQHKAVPACSAADLRASAAFQGATGSQLGAINMTNTSTLRCALPAAPDISLSWHGHSLAVRTIAFPAQWLDRMNPRWSHRVAVLRPHAHAQVVLQWFNWCGPTTWGASTGLHVTVAVSIPHQPAPILATTRDLVEPPFCNVKPRSGTGSTVRVSPFVSP